MNDQPYVKEGFYLHFEKGLYKIVDFAYNKTKTSLHPNSNIPAAI
jgi:hypothetical protein